MVQIYTEKKKPILKNSFYYKKEKEIRKLIRWSVIDDYTTLAFTKNDERNWNTQNLSKRPPRGLFQFVCQQIRIHDGTSDYSLNDLDRASLSLSHRFSFSSSSRPPTSVTSGFASHRPVKTVNELNMLTSMFSFLLILFFFSF